jgi:hypothetical protein
MLRRFILFISVLAVALSMIGASALRARADESPPTLSPTQGPAGTHVTASASDWPGCSSMSVSGWGQATLGTAAVSASGAFTLSFTVPGNAPLGAAQLVFSPACSHSTILTVATFTVTQGTQPPPSCSPSVSLTPSSGAVGSKFVMAGKGWLAGGTWQLTAIVGKPSAAGGYTFTYAESGCASKTGTFTVTASPPTSCPAVHFIGFHGTGQSEADPQYLGMGQTVLATWQALASHGTVSGRMVVSADPFPAVDLPSTNNVVTAATQGWAYAQAAINAAATATKQIESITAECPKTKFVFVGYSLGALIAHMTLQNLSQAKFNLANVVAVVFFGDPIYPQVKSTPPREGVGRAIGLWSNGALYVPGNLGNRTLSICLSYNLRPPTVSKARVAYDPVCMVTTPIKQDVNLKACVAGKTRNSVLCPHTQYVSLGAPKVAAAWLAKILNIH